MGYIKTDWKNLPNQTTPVSKDNLNKIEQGIYDATYENGLNVSNEVDEDYRVNVLKNIKNLLNTNIKQCSIGPNGEEITTDASIRMTFDYIKIDANKQIIFSCNDTATLIGIAYYDSSKTYISRVTNNTVSSISGTTPNNCTYVRPFITGFNSTISSINQYEMQLELGSTRTTYEEVITPSIYVDNEEIYSKPSVRDYYNDITLNTTNVSINSNNLHYYKKRSDGLIVFTITLSAKVAMTSGTAYDLFTIPSDVNPSSNFPYIVGSYNKGYGVAYIQSLTRLMRFKPFQNLAIGDEIHLTGCYYQN